ncbi:helix-turn-helix transcriptional regulator [Streptomyces sp. NPDC001941]|uniref:helix-turn-helix domain-containing protein n=1 Tax=Streptomyces sp. NPDC001941 TaxID=3154659 RepID=UPI003323B4E2
MAVSPSSNAQQARQALAKRLADLCRDAGLNGQDMADRCGWHRSKSSRIMNGRTPPSADDIRAWCRACGAEDQTEDLVASLRAADGMWVDWRRMERTGLRRAQEAVLPLFERTRWFRSYSPSFVPGLLQTRDYTGAVLRATQRRRVLIDDVDEAVAVRMARQQILHQGGRFAFLAEESVLRNGLGGREVQREQLEHLLAAGALPSVSLGIVPTRTDRTRMPTEGFYMFDSAQVNVEMVSGYLTLVQPSEVRAYADTFTMLGDMAVFGAGAQALIGRALDDLR